MRPIDADALIEKCGGWYVDECTESGFIGTLENLLATEPTIQPQSTTGQINDGVRSTARSTDLIDRQAAIDALDKRFDSIPMDQTAEILKLRKDLRELPPAQPEPHEGYWIEGRIYRDVIECNCSECGQLMTTAATVRMNFCPNCGAKMKGAQNERTDLQTGGD